MTHLNDQIVRLYDTVFERAPDAGGLEFWNQATHRGLSMGDMADQFITVPEFSATYGEPTNVAFVRSMYANVLDRPGEAEGVSFWTRVLDEGLADRGHIAFEFSESGEHIAQMGAPADVVLGPGHHPRGEHELNDTTLLAETSPGPYPANGDPKPQYTPRDGATLVGGDGFDQLYSLGHTGTTLWGQGGNDQLQSWDGSDTLHGGPGNDRLNGQGGNDRLNGGPGSDTMSGGAGDDVFLFQMGRAHEADTITDFQPGDHVEFYGPEPVVPYAISTGPGLDGPLVFDLLVSREHLHTIHFQGLTMADEGWVRDAFSFA